MESKDYDLQTMFDEAQKQLERQYKSSATLRNHAKTIIGVSSVIVSFFATFKIFDRVSLNSNWILLASFVFMGVSYLALMIAAIWAASPFALASPINPSIEDYKSAYADKDQRTITSNQIILYLRAIGKNDKTIREQYFLTNIIDCLLGLVVISIIFTTILASL